MKKQVIYICVLLIFSSILSIKGENAITKEEAYKLFKETVELNNNGDRTRAMNILKSIAEPSELVANNPCISHEHFMREYASTAFQLKYHQGVFTYNKGWLEVYGKKYESVFHEHKANMLWELACTHYYLDDYENAIQIFEQLLNYCKIIDNNTMYYH